MGTSRRNRHRAAGASASLRQRHAWSVFLAALGLLVLNDFWFKGAGFMPHWVTGKLSDVAGLIVAPATLALLLKGRWKRLYPAGFALIALVFAAVELSPFCSELLIGALAELGLSWTLWADPTDLLALLVLPTAWKISSALAQGAARDRSRLMMLPAAAACLASGEMPTEINGSMMVYNGTSEMIELSVARVPWLECAALEQLGDQLIEDGDFQSRERVRLAPAAAFPLRQRRDCGCGLYRLSAGGRSIVVRAPDGSVTIDRHPTVEQRRRHRDRMLLIAEEFLFAPGKAIQTVAVPDEAKTEDCGAEPPALAFSAPWSAQYSFKVVDLEVLAVEPVAGNCFGVTVRRTSVAPVGPGEPAATPGSAGAAGAGGAEGIADAVGAGGTQGIAGAAGDGEEVSVPLEPVSLYLCAPIELFPFSAGDVVEIDGTTAENSEHINLRTDDRRFTIRISEQPEAQFQVQPGACGPIRDGDGAPWLTVPVMPDHGFTELLVPGQVTSFEQAGGRLDMYLGRSRRVLGCGDREPDQPGKLSVEIVERWSL